jgi:DNA ligase-1
MLAASLLPAHVEHTDENILEAMKKLRYPVLASVKMDGIRALKTEAGLVSRTLKLIPNESIRRRADKLPVGFDMELWGTFRYDEIASIVMSEEHILSDQIEFNILDVWNRTYSYNKLPEYFMSIRHIVFEGVCELCECVWINNAQELLEYFRGVEDTQGEGICFRTLDSPYKQGRSTLREQYLVKLARMVRTEVTITGFEEQMLNTNGERRHATGQMKRSSAQAGMIGKDTLGSFAVRDSKGREFTVGSGLTDSLRKQVWEQRDRWLGRTITIKHKPHGEKIKPRSPIYVGLRTEGY